ncbi:hypothetical protein [Vallitalea sp.]|jgi:hypothetical protein|uniref:hypothetical protein n=1 Tax=Vallitalea sp. TaxID=1882829 RepID=UPI0025CB84A4|nr:hypothetical protein [Vallitalea sp.]MCT4686180.1 hypothetical protein [Vallitalea sp.]
MFKFINNDTVALVFLGFVAVIGAITKQEVIVSGAIGAAGIKYYIKIKGYSGSGQYKVRCKNYTDENSKAYAIRCYDGKTEIRKEANFYSSKSYGWIGFEEEVTVLGVEGPFSKIEYSTGSGSKQGYVYTKCILPISFKDKDKNKELLPDGEWYNPYSDGWYMTQAFNDLDTGYQGHLGHDLFNGADQSVRAIYHGTVKDAKYSGANGGDTVNAGQALGMDGKFRKRSRTFTFGSIYWDL